MRETSPSLDEASSQAHVTPRRTIVYSSFFCPPLHLLLVLSIVCGGGLLAFIGSASHAQAATTATKQVATSLPPTFTGIRKPEPALKFSQVPNPNAHAVRPNAHAVRPNASALRANVASTVNSSTPLNGLGDGSLYTFVDKSLSDHLDLKVNVANGNLVLHTTELQINGSDAFEGSSGYLPIVVGSYYNSQANTLLEEHGVNWTFSTGSGTMLDVSAVSSGGGITFYAPNGLQAFFAPKTGGGYSDAPGLNATLRTQNSTNCSDVYCLYYHQSGETWYYNKNGVLDDIVDKNFRQLDMGHSAQGYWNSVNNQGFVDATLDGNNQLKTLTVETKVASEPNNRTITYGYDSSENLSSITDALNQQTTFGYDTNNKLTSITDPMGYTTTITYLNGKVNTITDANQNQETFTYNSGNTVVNDFNGHTTTFTYQSNLQVIKTTDALGHSTAGSFDPNTYNVNTYSDALAGQANEQTSYTYDVTDTNSKVIGTTDPTGATTQATYYTSTTLPSGDSQNVAYQPITQKDNQGNETDFSYDANGNLLTQTDKKSGNQLQYSYNADGTVAAQKDGNGHVTTYSYGGTLTSITPPAPLGKTTFTYDALNRESTETDGNGHTTSYVYDALDRITKIWYSDNTSISYAYDKDGSVLTEVDATGTTSFTYDKLNRQITKTLPSQTVITNGYDKIGNLTSLKDTSGTVTYSYDQVNRMTTLTDADGLKTTYTYDNDNRKSSIQYPNGTGQIMIYDLAGRVTSIIGGKGSISIDSNNVPHFNGTQYTNFGYTYTSGSVSTDLLQQQIALDPVNPSNTDKFTYTYSSKNELVGVQRQTNGSSNGQWTYKYDSNGNRTNLAYSNNAQHSYSYIYNAANELTTAQGSYTTTGGTTTTMTLTYQYDGDGNETSLATTGATPPDTASLSRTGTYNTANQIIGGSSPGGTYSYGYSGTSQEDRVKNNSLNDTYTSLGLSSETGTSGTTEYVRCSCGLLNSLHTPDGKKYYYLFDREGSIAGVTDSSGNDVDRYSYDPFGTKNGTWQVQVNQPWTYAGGYYDSGTGLYKYGIRFYDSTTARWTQATPIGGSLQEALKANPYEYADDDPANAVDPSGKATADCGSASLTIGEGSAFGAWSIVVSIIATAPIVSFNANVIALMTYSNGFVVPFGIPFSGSGTGGNTLLLSYSVPSWGVAQLSGVLSGWITTTQDACAIIPTGDSYEGDF